MHHGLYRQIGSGGGDSDLRIAGTSATATTIIKMVRNRQNSTKLMIPHNKFMGLEEKERNGFLLLLCCK